MLSDNIRNYRKENNMSQDELAEKLGVSRQSISLWETGQTQPTIDNIIALAKIFNVTSDDILRDADSTADVARLTPVKTTEEKKKSKAGLVIAIVAAAVILMAGAAVSVLYGDKLFGGSPAESGAAGSSVSQEESTQTEGKSGVAESKSSVNTSTSSKKSDTSKAGTKPANNNSTSGKSTSADNSSKAAKPAAERIDLFSYCKDFAIKKGNLNGDYTIYQQSAANYGGSDKEYFSLSYWGDSNMVEFCLHCPLNDTYSINFYLRMRGGYNKKYEYLTSYYYRDTGESVRSATGYIDPAVFSDKYPLNCDEYTGGTDKQNDFMEESRVGICDLIRCLKRFAEVEKMECGFSAFEFVNF